MHMAELTAPEQRVLGCLIEKRWTTPDQYPLSLNALRLACNQSTNREPVTDYDESTVREAAQRLSRYGLARLASGHGSRATKYRHLAEEALGLGREELALLAVLLLRGPQTPGELKARTERMASLGSLERVDEVLAELCRNGYARRMARRPGQKEDRFEHLLGGAAVGDAIGREPEAAAGDESETEAAAPSPPAPSPPPAKLGDKETPYQQASRDADDGRLEDRVSGLEEDASALREELAALREDLATLREDLATLREDLGAAAPTS